MGSEQNLVDLVYLEGIDIAFVQSDVLSAVRNRELGNKFLDDEIAEKKIAYVTKLYDEEIHILALPGITNIKELDGQNIAVGPEHSGSAL